MRKYLTIGFIAIALVMSVSVSIPALAPVQIAHATHDGTSHEEAAASANPATDPDTAAPAQVPITQSPPAEEDGTLTWMMNQILTMFSWMLTIAALALDSAVYYMVLKMGTFINDLSAIGVTWRILRDIGNIILIFGFLAIGISIILDSDLLGYGQKMLPRLLIAAVALNFSLFAAEAVIDTGNLFATQFYTQINGGIPAGEKFSTVGSEGISSKVLAQLGLQTIYGDPINHPELLERDNNFIVNVMGILLFLVAAFVFFTLALILVSRFVILIFLIITSPIGVAGFAMPKLEGIARQWWSQLFSQTITAPILLLGLYIALAVITDERFLTGFGAKPSGYTAFNKDLVSYAGTLLSFIVAMGLLLGVALLSKKLGAFGSDWAMKWGGRLSFGATALGASALTGVSAYGLRRGVQRLAPTTQTGRAVQRLASRGLRRIEGARMDVRSIPGVSAGFNLTGADAAAGPIGRSAAGRVRQAGDWWRTSSQEGDRQFDQETRLPRLRTAIADNDHATIGRILGNMSDKELEEASAQRLIANSPAAAAALTQARFDKLLTSDALSDAQKTALRNQRRDGLRARYTSADEYRNPTDHPTAPNAPIPSILHPGTNMTRGEQAVRALTNEAAGQLTDDILTLPDVYRNLSIRQLNAIQTAGRIQTTTAATVGAHLQTDPTFAAYYRSRNPQQRVDMRDYWSIPTSVTFPP